MWTVAPISTFSITKQISVVKTFASIFYMNCDIKEAERTGVRHDIENYCKERQRKHGLFWIW